MSRKKQETTPKAKENLGNFSNIAKNVANKNATGTGTAKKPSAKKLKSQIDNEQLLKVTSNYDREDEDEDDDTVQKKRKRVISSKAAKKKTAENGNEGSAPPELSEIELEMAKLLDDAQHSFATHNRVCQQLKVIAEKGLKDHNSITPFVTALGHHIDRTLIIPRRDATVERIVELIGKRASNLTNDTTLNDEISFLLMQQCVKRSYSSDKMVRFRCCQLVCLLLTSMSEEAEINEDFFTTLQETLLLRARDRHPLVRSIACTALSRLLETSEDEENIVASELLRIATYDTSVDVRKAAINSLNISILPQQSRDILLLRIRDTSSAVRIHMFNHLKSHWPFRSLTVQQRATLMRSGLNDRDAKVREACGALLSNWIKKSNGDVLALLRALGCIVFIEEAESVITYILDNHLPCNSPQPPYTSLELITEESSLYWRVLVEKFGKEGNDEEAIEERHMKLQQVLVEPSLLCSFLDEHKSSSFIQMQLLSILLYADYTDERTRWESESLVCKQLAQIDVEDKLVPIMMKVLRRIYGTDEHGFIRLVLEKVMSDLRDPLEEQRTAAEAEEYAPTAERTWVRLLHVAAELLAHIERATLDHPGLASLLTEYILPALTSSDAFTREPAIRTLGLFCLMDREMSEGYIALTFEAMRRDCAPIQIVALKNITDMVMMYDGLLKNSSTNENAKADDSFDEIEEVEDDEGESPLNISMASATSHAAPPITSQPIRTVAADDLLECILAFIDDLTVSQEDNDVVLFELATTAVESLCKLLLYDRFPATTALLSRLVALYFLPSIQGCLQVVQSLDVFFHAYIAVDVAKARLAESIKDRNSSSIESMPKPTTLDDSILKDIPETIGGHTQLILQSFIPTLKLLGSTKKSAKETAVPIPTVIRYFIALLSEGETSKLSMTNIHSALAVIICNFMAKFPRSPLCKPLSTSLSLLKVEPSEDGATEKDQMDKETLSPIKVARQPKKIQKVSN